MRILSGKEDKKQFPIRNPQQTYKNTRSECTFMKKRLLSAALCLCMLLTLLPTVALADGGNEQMGYSAAILHDESGFYQDDELYDAGSYQLAASMETGGYSVSATNLKQHQNGQGTMGYWAGVAVTAPANATQMKVAMSTTAAPSLEDVTATALEERVFVDEEGTAYDGVAFYADTAKVTTLYCAVQWLDADGKVVTSTNETGTNEVYSFTVDFSGVTHYEETGVAQVGGRTYATLAEAVNAVTAENNVITLVGDVELSATGVASGNGAALLTIDKNLTIDGQGLYTIKGVDFTSEQTNIRLLNVVNGADVTLKNLTLDGSNSEEAQGARHGLNIWEAGTVTLEQVTIQNCDWYAVVNNGSELVVNGLTTTGNAWGINLDGGGSAIINDAAVAETSSIVYDNVTDSDAYLTVNGGSYQNIVIKAENSSETCTGNITLTGGTFNGITTEGEGTSNAEAVVSVTGGTYINTSGDGFVSVSGLLATGCDLDENGAVVPAEGSVASIGSVGYASLADALNAAVDGDTVVLLENADLSNTIDSGVTLTVNKDITLTIDAANLSTLIASQGKIRVNAGGVLAVGGTKMISGSDANISLAKGYIDVSIHASALMLEFTGATAEVPEGHRWTLSKSVGQTTIPINVIMDETTTLTVNSTGADGEDDGLRVANSAKLMNFGKIIVNGVMSISSTGEVYGDGTIEVASGGMLEVNMSKDTGYIGTLANDVSNSGTFIWNGDDGTKLSHTITLASGGKVYSQADVESKLSGSKRTLSDKTCNGTEYAYAWEYYVSSSSSSSGSSSYTVTVSSATNGKVTVSPTRAAKDDEVTITVTPDDGYVLDALTVKDASDKAIAIAESNGKYTFKMPGSAVTVSATFKAESSSLPFTDVDTGDWFYEAVQYAYENGMMNGVGNNLFAPSSNLTRGMIAQVLYNLEGTPAAGNGVFTDVAADQWYADAVNWAAANDIVGGYGNGKFGPEDDITREQMAQILYNYATFKGYDVSVQDDLSTFNDGAKTSDWALSAMKWAVGSGLLQGYNGNLNPTGTATRAEVAQILMNFCENIAK